MATRKDTRFAPSWSPLATAGGGGTGQGSIPPPAFRASGKAEPSSVASYDEMFDDPLLRANSRLNTPQVSQLMPRGQTYYRGNVVHAGDPVGPADGADHLKFMHADGVPHHPAGPLAMVHEAFQFRDDPLPAGLGAWEGASAR